MKTTNFIAFLLFSAILVVSSCTCNPLGNSSPKEESSASNQDDENKRDDDDTNTNDEPKNLADAMKQATDAINQLKDEGQLKEVVPHRELKETLPEKAAGLKAVNRSSQKAGYAGMNLSMAEGEYRDGNKKIEITISDAGGVTGALTGLAAWMQIEIDKESDTGFERTTTIDGNKGFEKYNNQTQSGELSVYIKNRFVVVVKGFQVAWEEIKKAYESIDVKSLEKKG